MELKGQRREGELFWGITWFLGQMEGVLVVAQQSIKCGGGGGAMESWGRKHKMLRSLKKGKRFHDSSDTRENLRLKCFFFSVAKRSDTS